jgi:carbon monoxide dehydrogenase subunit G
VVVAVRPAELWSYLEDIARHVEWMADARSIEFETDQRHGVGTRFVCDTRVGPLRIDDTLTVTEWDPPHTMGIRHDGAVSGTGVFQLAPADRPGHTELTWTEELRFLWGMGAGVGGRAAAPVLRRIWAGNLERLRRRAEAELSSPPPTR